MTDEEAKREADLFLVRSREVLKATREQQQYVDRAVAESLRSIRRALLQLRRGY